MNNVQPHVDHHAWAFSGGKVYDGNDGGIWRFTPLPNNAAGPGTWESLNTPGFQTILVNSVSMCPTSPKAALLVGSQDNGVARDATGTWSAVLAGDGGMVAFDPEPGARSAYAALHFGDGTEFLFRSDDFGYHFAIDISATIPFGNDSIGSTTSPAFTIHPSQTHRLLLGLKGVYETSDKGQTWKMLSAPLAGDFRVTALAYAGDDMYAGYESGRVFKHAGGAQQFTELKPGQGKIWGGQITAIAVDPKRADHVYVMATDGNLYGLERSGHVWRTADAGANWSEITGNLSSMLLESLVVYPVNAPDPWLFAGTSAGVFVLPSQGPEICWRRFGTGLPDALVSSLDINLNASILGAGTYGRGVFQATVGPLVSPSVKIHVPKDECGVGPVQNTVVTFSLATQNLPDNTEFAWKVTGGVQQSATNDRPTFAVLMPPNATPVTVSVAINADGCTLARDSATFTPLDLLAAQFAEFRCLLWTFIQVNFRKNPLFDSQRDLAVHPFTERDVAQTHQLAQQLSQLSQRVLDFQRLNAETFTPHR